MSDGKAEHPPDLRPDRENGSNHTLNVPAIRRPKMKALTAPKRGQRLEQPVSRTGQ
jgi:hypothetical protein